jgi:hypothetical protein
MLTSYQRFKPIIFKFKFEETIVDIVVPARSSLSPPVETNYFYSRIAEYHDLPISRIDIPEMPKNMMIRPELYDHTTFTYSI